MYCHLNVKTDSRATGQSAGAKYDYICREERYAEARQDEVVHVESGCLPTFAASDARAYWAAADLSAGVPQPQHADVDNGGTSRGPLPNTTTA